MFHESKKNQAVRARLAERGQALLIVILVIIASLTIGLSLASRGITNLRTSTEEADSQKALAAAEAGIEEALRNTVPNSGNFNISTTYDTTVDPQSGDRFLLNGGSLITQGEGADVWFADHKADGSIDYDTVSSPKFFHLHWGAAGETCTNDPDPSKWPAAIEAIVVYGASASDINTTRFAYDPCSLSRGNNFVPAEFDNETIGGKTFTIKTPENGANQDLTKKNNIIFMRVVPVYKSTVIGVRACNNGGGKCTDLPSQGYLISSTGTTDTASRKLKVFKGHEQLFLPYISYGLFVPTR